MQLSNVSAETDGTCRCIHREIHRDELRRQAVQATQAQDEAEHEVNSYLSNTVSCPFYANTQKQSSVSIKELIKNLP